MSRGEYVQGLAWFGAVAGCTALATALAVRARLDHLPGAVRATAAGVVAAVVLVAVHLLPLALGMLTRGTVLGVAVVAVIVAARLPRLPAAEREPDRGRPSGSAAWLLAGLAVGGATLYVIAFGLANHGASIADIDSTAFILPGIAEWIQTGTLWQVHDLSERWGFASYPHTGNLLQLAVILPWHSDFLLRGLGPLWLAMSGLATYALACELRAPRAAAATFAAVGAMATTAAESALETAHTDAFAAAALIAGVLFLARNLRTRGREDLIVAALALGLAFGTKWYAMPYALAIAACWLAAVLMVRVEWRRALTDAAWLLALVTGTGGVWLVRNLVESGNPVFPGEIAALGVTVFESPSAWSFVDRLGFSLLDYLGDWDVLNEYLPSSFERSFGLTGALAVGALIAAVVLTWRYRGPERRAVALVSVLAALLLLIYTALPFSALGPEGQPALIVAATRYAVPALLLAMAVAAWVAGRLGGAGVGLQALGVGAMVFSFSQLREAAPRLRFDAVGPRQLVFAVAVVIAIVALGWAARRTTGSRRQRLAVGWLVVAVGFALVGDRQQQAYSEARYRDVDPTYEWVLDHAPSGQRIGLAGDPNRDPNSPQIVMYGPRMENQVEFVGEHRDHLLVRHTSRERFIRHLSRNRYDAVLVGHPLGRPASREERWVRAARWVPVARGERLTLFRPPPPGAMTTRLLSDRATASTRR